MQDKSSGLLAPKSVVLDTTMAWLKTCASNVLYHDKVRSLVSHLCTEVQGGSRKWDNTDQGLGSCTTMGGVLHTPDAQLPNTCTRAGTSIILGVLFYLLQAREYLQEGMTYKLGLSFYLAWIGVFVFLMTGLGSSGVGFGHGFSGRQTGAEWDRAWDEDG